MRATSGRYADPLDLVWLECADRLGLRVERSRDVYAATDGRRTLRIGGPSDLDPDDCLAQIILHELCHWLVAGPAAIDVPDWGLDNTSDADRAAEHAALRVQAALLDPWGLRRVLAPTTEHRAFYDGLGDDPLEPRADPTSTRARQAVVRARRAPFAPHLERALEASARIVHAVVAHGVPDETLFSTAAPVRPRHRLGGHVHRDDEARCGRCVWIRRRGRGVRVGDCTQHGARVRCDERACDRFEESLDCRRCAACCREGYDVVPVGPREPLARRAPHLLLRHACGQELRRDGGRCIALTGPDAIDGSYACALYEIRPRACRELEPGGPGCLHARRQIGLSL
ncbi:MAG: YkgJ family cysteine cluster protein [Myxococcota bacterium]|nr:YkgJ family cysteine cluster protein [Myxococcota bacterium]MDW8362393.1 YkgJ family cysteine cluster protein [Myxococcales bacterium]